MTSLQRRICKLEATTATAHAIAVPEWAIVMREKRRRRLEAEGRPHVEPEPVIVENPNDNDWASVMRACRARRAAEAQRAEAAQ